MSRSGVARILSAGLAATLGVTFFFAIIGVFGFEISLLALMIFIAAAVLIVARAPAGKTLP